MLLRWMRQQFDTKGNENVKRFVSLALYKSTPEHLDVDDTKIVEAFLAGAKLTAAHPQIFAILRWGPVLHSTLSNGAFLRCLVDVIRFE